MLSVEEWKTLLVKSEKVTNLICHFPLCFQKSYYHIGVLIMRIFWKGVADNKVIVALLGLVRKKKR